MCPPATSGGGLKQTVTAIVEGSEVTRRKILTSSAILHTCSCPAQLLQAQWEAAEGLLSAFPETKSLKEPNDSRSCARGGSGQEGR